MEIVTGNKEVLKKEIDLTLYIIEHGKLTEKIAAMLSLKGLLVLATKVDINLLGFDKRTTTQPYLVEEYKNTIDSSDKKFNNNFIINKDFHNDYLKKILYIIGKELMQIDPIYKSKYQKYIKKDDYFNIINLYLEKINKKELFIKLIKEEKIFELKNQLDKDSGIVSYNICTKNKFMFLENLDGSLNSLLTLAHEFGHIIDASISDKKYSPNTLMKQRLLSVYNEVKSKQIEKDFLHFLINEDIYKKEAQDLLLNYYWLDYDTIYSAYILSYLPNDLLIKNKYEKLLKEELIKYLPEEYNNSYEYIHNLNLLLHDDLNYGYGAIVSEFLGDRELDDNFYNYYRSKLFDRNFFIENDLSAHKFQKIYTKKIEKLI